MLSCKMENKLEEYMGNRDPQDLENWLLRSYAKKMMGGKKTIKKHKSIRKRKGKSRKSNEKNKVRSSKRRKSKKIIRCPVVSFCEVHLFSSLIFRNLLL